MELNCDFGHRYMTRVPDVDISMHVIHGSVPQSHEPCSV